MMQISQKLIVVVGSINLDLVATADSIPVPGQTILGGSFQTHFGGKGANQAVAAAKLGANVAMIGCVGTDEFGKQLLGGLRTAGVKTEAVSRIEGSSGVALITTDTRGENSIVVVPGANAALDVRQLRRYEDLVQAAGVVLAQLEIPMETVEHLAEVCEKSGIPLILDPAPAQSLSAELLKRCAWVTPNESEAQILCGSAAENEPEIVELLRNSGAQNLILKQGARGVSIAEVKKGIVHVDGFAVRAVDTTAAGDAFNGAFAVAMAGGETITESVRFANAVAAISVTRAGAQPSMPTLVEVEKFLAESGSH
jgi:ribokinase